MNCTGESLKDALFRLACVTVHAPTCLIWDADAQAYDVGAVDDPAATCRPVNWTYTNTTCACDAAALLGSDVRDDDAAATTTRSASVTSGSLAMLLYFGSVFSVPVNAALFLRNRTLLITFAAVAGFVLLNVLFGAWRDRRDRALTVAEDNAEARADITASAAEPVPPPTPRAAIADDDNDGRNGESQASHSAGEQRVVADCSSRETRGDGGRTFRSRKSTFDVALKASLPDFVVDRSLCTTFARAMLENHSLLSCSALSPFDPLAPRAVRVLGRHSLPPFPLDHVTISCPAYVAVVLFACLCSSRRPMRKMFVVRCA